MKRFENKVVLVTGGTVGIGLGAAEAFAREGARVVVSARREGEGLAAAKKIRDAGGKASFFRADVSSEADVRALVEHVVRTHDRLDVVFNNAGVEGTIGPIESLSSADFDHVFSINVRGSVTAERLGAVDDAGRQEDDELAAAVVARRRWKSTPRIGMSPSTGRPSRLRPVLRV
jgi:NAD(P)-dependent dehydrogenase (short-subunit alcohol dehydrogenase family)